MSKFTLRHQIDCTPETFWTIFLDQPFNTELYLKALGFSDWRILEQRDTETAVFRKVTGQPKMNMPGPVMKLMGPGFGYVEEGKLDKATKVWTWKITPSTLADKIKHEGSLKIVPLGEKRCERVVEILLEAKIFGIGGMVESATEKTLREGWDGSAVFMNKWIAEKGLGH